MNNNTKNTEYSDFELKEVATLEAKLNANIQIKHKLLYQLCDVLSYDANAFRSLLHKLFLSAVRSESFDCPEERHSGAYAFEQMDIILELLSELEWFDKDISEN